ncbi:membrane protein [Gordonia phage Dalilpop]|nr:membrane protein [Gordonia phage Dalilpop]
MKEDVRDLVGSTASIGMSLLITFSVLRLTDVIDWSWGWVLAPLWAPAVLFGGAMGLSLLVVRIRTALTRKGRR